ncbi:MAG TPA: GNAT family N-acetyltransferase, partial [Candidatus Limnocylindria bacterium]|nr:GNAT family N-acetyltransferase [Candidatus Limnocylindria bacterium]
MASPVAATVIRGPLPSDAAVLAALATQLGYPTDPTEMSERLAAVGANQLAAVFVAARPQDRPLGWIHVELKRSLASSGNALVAGLVVDEAARSAGIGRRLLDRAEAWAREHGCQTMQVASRRTRERAHRFYLREGYTVL